MRNRKVTIHFDGEEYRVPAPDGREAGAAYTDDKEDALGTARHMWGEGVEFTIKRVDCLPGNEA